MRAARSRAEFDAFVIDGTDGLLRTAYLVVGDRAEAEDLVQETLMRVAKRWPKVRAMEHPLAYARRILVNLAVDGADRRNRRRAELSLADAAANRPDPVATNGHLDNRAVLIAALAQLPPRQRAVLVLRYFLDLPEAEAAAALGCSLGTVKSSASRGLARLEQALQPESDRSIK